MGSVASLRNADAKATEYPYRAMHRLAQQVINRIIRIMKKFHLIILLQNFVLLFPFLSMALS